MSYKHPKLYTHPSELIENCEVIVEILAIQKIS